MRTARYQEIATDLRRQLAAGEFSDGGLLPSEAELGAAYAASRVTVRKALEQLRDEGLLLSRQGVGWQPALDPLRQTLGRLGTIEAQLTDAGIESTRNVLDFGFVSAPARVRRVLGARRVLEVRRLNLADNEPFARVTVWCAETLGRQLSLADVERTSFYELLDIELGGATQTIAAAGATKSDAELLGVATGSPVLLCTRVTNDVAGEPVLMSEHVFPAHRTQFVVSLPHVERSIAPSGLRLVGQGR
ncbi:MAG: GntR family transcriptional regulator [Acidimicrobiaceae bacterium]